MDGILRCSRYAFGPNRLHYCGPDASGEILAHLNEGISNPGLEALLSKFQTMYPYLRQIAISNRISDPFDGRVVEAYWIGNRLLENIGKQDLYIHYIDDHHLKKKLNLGVFNRFTEKIGRGAKAHHSFHVFNVWKRTGHAEEAHTLESFDACRISWGTVEHIDGPFLTVKTQPLVLTGDKLALGAPVKKQIARQLEAANYMDELTEGDIITMHWDIPCEVISVTQAGNLKRYTQKSIELANEGV